MDVVRISPDAGERLALGHRGKAVEVGRGVAVADTDGGTVAVQRGIAIVEVEDFVAVPQVDAEFPWDGGFKLAELFVEKTFHRISR
ncbi:MAG: hypothetical protein ACPGGJ_02800 [Coraliomargarita sp.]